MKHKGYIAAVEYDDSVGRLHGWVEIEAVVADDPADHRADRFLVHNRATEDAPNGLLQRQGLPLRTNLQATDDLTV